MLALFLAITAFNLLCLCLTAGLGYRLGGTADGQWHQLAGVISTIVSCAVHCIVFTYFVATAKWVQHAIEVKHLDAQLAAPTRSFKAQAFPAAIIAMAAVFFAAVLGVARFSYGIPARWHEWSALGAIAVNGLVAAVEYRAIARNARLIDHILELIRVTPAPPATTMPTPPAPVAERQTLRT